MATVLNLDKVLYFSLLVDPKFVSQKESKFLNVLNSNPKENEQDKFGLGNINVSLYLIYKKGNIYISVLVAFYRWQCLSQYLVVNLHNFWFRKYENK